MSNPSLHQRDNVRVPNVSSSVEGLKGAFLNYVR